MKDLLKASINAVYGEQVKKLELLNGIDFTLEAQLKLRETCLNINYEIENLSKIYNIIIIFPNGMSSKIDFNFQKSIEIIVEKDWINFKIKKK